MNNFKDESNDANDINMQMQRSSEKQQTDQSDIYGEVPTTNKLIKFYSVLTTEFFISYLWLNLATSLKKDLHFRSLDLSISTMLVC